MIDIELAFASPEGRVLLALQLVEGATVGDAIRKADLDATFPQYLFGEMAVGIWGKRAAREQRLKHGDRVEIYRELVRDPMEARRLRALGSNPGPSESR
ncbi:MAG: RnfH family protein [Proteobacteria bacterium]|nr:RnfH family protein [Pseudomonadota bacterium]